MNRSEREQRNAAMKAFKAEGHNMREVAERFGVSEGTATKICKGIAPQKAKPPEWKNNQYTVVPIDERGRQYIERYAPGFEYAGNYKGQNSTIDMKCKACGSVQTRSAITLRHRNTRCEACYQEKIEARKKAKQAKKKPTKKKPTTPLVLPVRSASQLTFNVCKECGAVFLPEHNGQRYCSDVCRRKEANRKSSRRKDWRLLGKIVDRDIDLRDLARMSGDVCALCGKAVDWNDYEVRENGVIVCGNYYPSIDHIVPVSGEGLHAWGNVQLAHRICNTRKGATLPGA